MDDRQLDVKNALLHGHLKEIVFTEQPCGFTNPSFPNHVCQLRWALYSLKQALRVSERLSLFIINLGFSCSKLIHLFYFKFTVGELLLLIYVDDTIITGTNTGMINYLFTLLRKEFSSNDLGELHYFLGVEVIYRHDGLFLNQNRYALSLLERECMQDCKPSSTPLPHNHRLRRIGDSIETTYHHTEVT